MAVTNKPAPAGILQRAINWAFPSLPNSTPLTQDQVEKPGTIPTNKKARISGFGEPANLSRTLDQTKLQAAIIAAERGETRQLFTIYRDVISSSGHIQAEFQKRKMAVVGQVESIAPANKRNPEDVKAAAAVKRMIEDCDNWDDAIIHILDGTLFPLSVSEKLYESVKYNSKDAAPISWRLKRLEPVNYALLSFRLPYLVPGGLQLPATPWGNGPALNRPMLGNNPDTVWDPDSWEPDLRFYRVFPNGYIDYSYANMYAPDPMRHLVHRGHFMSSIRDNFGGPMRGVLFWWLMSVAGRDVFANFMQRYGLPIPMAKIDAQDKPTLEFLQNAFADYAVMGALLFDKRADVTFEQMNATNGAEGHKIYLDFCNGEISKIILGQELSTTSKPLGLGGGAADLQGRSLENINRFDKKKLAGSLKRQLFRPFLDLNGYYGGTPNITWGGVSEADTKTLSESLNNLSQAGLQPDDSGLEVISERVGFNIERQSIDTRQNTQPPGGLGRRKLDIPDQPANKPGELVTKE